MLKEEIVALSDEQLSENIQIEKDRLQKLKFNHAIAPLENPMEIRFSKKLIARLKTEERKRELQK